MPIIKANRVSFHVQRLGQGPLVTMVHGLLESLATWYCTSAPVLARKHHVFLHDLRGHGRSERTPTGYDVPTLARDLDALTAQYGTTPMTVVGNSYGGLVALRFALDHPERVARLVLVEAPVSPSRTEEIRRLFQFTPQELVDLLPRHTQAHLRKMNRQARRFLQSAQFLYTESSLRTDLQNEEVISDAQLACLQCPVLCVYGGDSPCRTVGERLSGVIPDAQLVLLPGGHYLHHDCGAALTDALVEFTHG